MFKSLFLLGLLIIPFFLSAQILPKEGSALNYRLIGFSFPAGDKAHGYKIEIASGNYTRLDSFKKHIIQTKSGKKNRIIAEVPSFGSQFTWRIVSTGGKSSESVSALHHFSTMTSPNVDTNVMRLRITKTSGKFKDAYVFLDGNGALYDMSGRPVWFLPPIEGFRALATDMKMSPKGTITFIFKHQAYEINYNGDILWQGPSDQKFHGRNMEQFHHEFTRLGNGHYMVLGLEKANVLKKWPEQKDRQSFIVSDDRLKQADADSIYTKAPFGTIVEYDQKGNKIWSWKSSAYLDTSDVCYYYRAMAGDNPEYDLHENAFFFDEKNQVVYVSFKTISRIIKIKYPEGTVLNSYGEVFKPGVAPKDNGLFYGQHSCKLSKDGYLYLYNNNMTDLSSRPQVLMLKEPVSPQDTLERIWQYDCTYQDINRDTEHEENLFKTGGNVVEMPDSAFFISMSNPYSKILIVARDKSVLWSALPEKWDDEQKMWKVVPQYRASPITGKKEIEHLIWNGEADK